MIWLTKTTGEAFGVNPTQIHSVEPHGRSGSVVNMIGQHMDVNVVVQTPNEIRQLIEDHEERFVEAFEALRLARESQQPE